MTDPTPQPDPAVVLTDAERDALRHLALIAHADGYEGRDSGMTQDRVLATVGRIVADALTDAERDQLWAGLRRARYEEAPIPLASEGNRTHVLWALSPAVERIIAARTADTAIRLAAVEAVMADGPETWAGYDSRDTGHVFAADLVLEFIADLRAALFATAPDAGRWQCREDEECTLPRGQHWHVTGPGSAPDAGQREAQERAEGGPA